MVEVTNTGEGRALAVEGNGINVISDAERTGRPADLLAAWGINWSRPGGGLTWARRPQHRRSVTAADRPQWPVNGPS